MEITLFRSCLGRSRTFVVLSELARPSLDRSIQPQQYSFIPRGNCDTEHYYT